MTIAASMQSHDQRLAALPPVSVYDHCRALWSRLPFVQFIAQLRTRRINGESDSKITSRGHMVCPLMTVDDLLNNCSRSVIVRPA